MLIHLKQCVDFFTAIGDTAKSFSVLFRKLAVIVLRLPVGRLDRKAISVEDDVIGEFCHAERKFLRMR